MVVPGFALLGHAALTRPPSDERRQLRAALIANLVVLSSLVDLALAYGVGWFPVGWLLSGIGSLLVVRALVVEDLLRVRAVDVTAPTLVLYFAAGALLAWVALAELAPRVPWPLTALVLILCFAAVRITVAAMTLVTRGARSSEGPLDRLLAQLVGRARNLAATAAIGRARDRRDRARARRPVPRAAGVAGRLGVEQRDRRTARRRARAGHR